MYLSPALHFVYFIYHLYHVLNYHASVCCSNVFIYAHLSFEIMSRSLDLKCPGMNMFVSVSRGTHVGIQVGVTKGTLTFPPVITGLGIMIEVFRCDCFL
jgi:hypothetical protein